MSETELKVGLLQDLGAMIAREVELDVLLETFGRRVAGAMRAERATLWILDAETGELRSQVANRLEVSELRLPVGRGVAGHVAQHGTTVNIADAATDPRWNPEVDQKTGFRTRSVLCTPIVDRRGRMRGVAQVLNKHDGSFSPGDEAFLTALCQQIARALEYTTLRGADAPRGVPIRGPFNHIVGPSASMAAVYERVLRAAATDATVLLRGETGTGKGLFARAIHVNSKRRDGPLIHVDGTNLPSNLVESELFGHERGAYTGADRRVPGKVELAAGGTLFIDELGEIPLELQSKLLRFLQERQYERVGGRQTLTSDVRIVAATNRNLEELVRTGKFRSDLYYRVRVIEIVMPPLRERGPNDLRVLAEHFLSIYARRYEKQSMRFSDAALRAIQQHRWPGNVRELEHAVERAVVLAPTEVIEPESLGLIDLELGPEQAASVASANGSAERPVEEPAPTARQEVRIPAGLELEEASRLYAEACIERHGGNRSAAARELGIGRNTLARLVRGD